MILFELFFISSSEFFVLGNSLLLVADELSTDVDFWFLTNKNFFSRQTITPKHENILVKIDRRSFENKNFLNAVFIYLLSLFMKPQIMKSFDLKHRKEVKQICKYWKTFYSSGLFEKFKKSVSILNQFGKKSFLLNVRYQNFKVFLNYLIREQWIFLKRVSPLLVISKFSRRLSARLGKLFLQARFNCFFFCSFVEIRYSRFSEITLNQNEKLKSSALGRSP